MIEKRLLPDSITIRKPVQTFANGSRQPVFDYQTLLTGVKARFASLGTSMSRNVTGQTPKQSFRLFLNPVELKENYEVLREPEGDVFVVTEVKDFQGHHMEAVLEARKCCG